MYSITNHFVELHSEVGNQIERKGMERINTLKRLNIIILEAMNLDGCELTKATSANDI